MKSLYESILSSNGAGRTSKEVDGYHIGDIVVRVIQYSARYVDFYEVIDIKGKSTIIVKKLKKEYLNDDQYGQSGHVLPIKGEYEKEAKEEKYRVGSRGLKIDNAHCHKWDGKPEIFYDD